MKNSKNLSLKNNSHPASATESSDDLERNFKATLGSVRLWSTLATLFIFPLIWVGGLVTTHDAGMAVPDWPGTYGYNLFLYPISTWLYGPFDLLIEHGHRLLGSWVGLLAIGLNIAAWTTESRKWYRWASLGLLLAVIAQGLLGGFRVVLDERTIAMLHGCGGPLVFAFASFLAIAASTDWRTAQPGSWRETTPGVPSRRVWRASWLLLIATVTQLVLGAQLRHALPNTSPTSFMAMVHLHLTFAAVVTILILVISVLIRIDFLRSEGTRDSSEFARIRTPANWLVGLLFVQLGLGLGTWFVNYALPWSGLSPSLAQYAIAAKGYWESMIVTAHQATGSLLISLSVWLICRVGRRLVPLADSQTSSTINLDNQRISEQPAAR
ncbi:MAG: Heme synthase [Planctomycetota bacterium]